MKVTVILKTEDGKTQPPIEFVPGETFAATLEQFDKTLEGLLNMEAPKVVVPPAAPNTRKAPYSPTNPAHPKEEN